ncbi:MAG: gliding motility protein GldN [Bacteroidia bacterium]|nr:gliding motility protein GldN [Bacteroidia bacterium]
MTKKILVSILFVLPVLSFAQLPEFSLFLNGPAIQNEGKPVAHRFLREANAKYSKRIHRVIDSRMKQNKDMAWPKNPLSHVIWTAVTKGYPDMDKPKAYQNDSLASTYSTKEIIEKGSIEEIVPIAINGDPNNIRYDTVNTPFDPKEIVKFRMMEDWIFDANYSDLRPRIIAIAPIYKIKSQTGINLGEGELFWVKMDELRPILAQQQIFNKKNDAARLSYDQWFRMRQFSSHIVKESNIYDLDIKYIEGFRDDGLAALMESDCIKNDLFITEHDLWEY